MVSVLPSAFASLLIQLYVTSKLDLIVLLQRDSTREQHQH